MSTPVGWLPAPATELFGPEAVAEESYEVLTVDVPPSAWLTALETARTTLSCTYFDWLSAVDEPGTGFRVAAHVVALHPVRRLLVRTTVPHDAPSLPSAVGVYAGAAWHERETHEMFGVVFEGHPGLQHLLLPENFEGHPLRKDFVLAARVAKAWPGAKEPGEPAAGAAHGAPKRRQMLPPGVPDPNEWGPLKGQLPPAPARPARAAGRAAGDRPVRRTRSAAEGSVGQTAQPTGEAGAGAGAGAGADAGAAVRPRRTRSASEGSASQAAARAEDAATRKQRATEADATRAAAQGPTEGPAAEASVAHEPGPAPAPARPRRARSAAEGSATQRTQAAPEPTSTEPAGPAKPAEPTQPAEPAQPAGPAGAARPARRSTAPRSSDAPWHHARPAFTEPETEPGPQPGEERAPQPEPQSAEERSPEPEQEPVREPRPAAPEDPDPGTDHPTTATPSTPDDPAGGPQ
ncbi:dehydrogenase [Streptomyces capoamus]|uniref:Dehydrogenase n=1 Tax=Streptomyces capoamus TaxID=68183 RepID=A0A919C3E3_9ACTN|nr:NADH-quinone oxidoreductase subunit C [Streptomyces capoamus]GGW16939.1 dehydrogenase [Streptomyces libani subsp. rufus]GHG38189.1 dehydrogenase [Streptomyces capoamus]